MKEQLPVVFLVSTHLKLEELIVVAEPEQL